jgi:hypothetical protein
MVFPVVGIDRDKPAPQRYSCRENARVIQTRAGCLKLKCELTTMIQSTPTEEKANGSTDDDTVYRWLCCVCGDRSDWQYNTRDEAAAARDDHCDTNSCGDIWGLVQTPADVDDYARPDIDRQRQTAHKRHRTRPSDDDSALTTARSRDTSAPDRWESTYDRTVPAADNDSEQFAIPAGVGYQLAGRWPSCALIGPCGRRLTDWVSEITVLEPGRAKVRPNRFVDTEIVRWQPDLRELDAYERHHGATPAPTTSVGGYADGELLAANEQLGTESEH